MGIEVAILSIPAEVVTRLVVIRHYDLAVSVIGIKNTLIHT